MKIGEERIDFLKTYFLLNLKIHTRICKELTKSHFLINSYPRKSHFLLICTATVIGNKRTNIVILILINSLRFSKISLPNVQAHVSLISKFS
jgi:hypothetical protein